MATPQNITTTDGQIFTHVEHVDMARLIYKRFGHELEAAAAAWRRMLGNGCSEQAFLELVEYPEHTSHCEGACQNRMNDDS